MPRPIWFHDKQTGDRFWRFPIDAKSLLADPERYERIPGPPPPKPVPATTQGNPLPPPETPPEPEPPKPPEPEAPEPEKEPDEPKAAHIHHRGFGKWDVIGADGSKVNAEPLDKPGAEALLATLT